MSIKRLLFISSLSLSLTGCLDFYGTQPPAPVISGDLASITKTPPPATQTQPPVAETVITRPLEKATSESQKVVEIKPQPLTVEQEQALLEKELQAELPEPATLPKEEAIKEPPAVTATPSVPEPPPPPPPPPAFQPLESFAPASPVVNSLLLAANQNSDSGNLESATTTIERAIRIEPRNPTLYYKLALLRLKQSKPVLAEDLAKKSALLATNNNQLKKHSWLLIARARELQKNPDGAKQARDMADKF